MKVQFLSNDNKLIYCDDDVLKITVNDKETVYKVEDLGKIEVEKNILYIYDVKGDLVENAKINEKEQSRKLEKMERVINKAGIKINEQHKEKIKENRKKTKLFWLSAIIVGLILGLFLNQDGIENLKTKNFKIEKTSIAEEIGRYVYWVKFNDFTEKEKELISRKLVRKTLKISNDVNSITVFFNGSDGAVDFRAEFEKDKENLNGCNKTGKYKGFYFGYKIY